MGSNNRISVYSNNFDRLWKAHSEEVLADVKIVGESGWYILGKEVESFESALAEYTNTAFTVGCANGMDAIEMSLRALGVKAGDKVITTPLSAFATALAIIRAGAEPVFVDVDEFGLICPKAVEAALSEFSNVSCIVPVHLYGHLADMRALSDIADKYGVVIVEDAAQGIGASRGGIRAGQLGATGCISFYPTKNLCALGDGGAIITDDKALADSLRTIRNYGQSEHYTHDVIGLNSRLDEVQAGILRRTMLKHLDIWIKRRREIAAKYLSEIKHSAVTTLGGPDPAGSVWHLFPVLIPAEKRLAFIDFLKKAGIQSGMHYPILIPDQKAIRNHMSPHIFDKLECAKVFSDCEVSLPINPFLSEGEVEYVIATINEWQG